jgi:ABC-type nitrate/sulfonate/bicarbonate transport system substrate-binding protein
LGKILPRKPTKKVTGHRGKRRKYWLAAVIAALVVAAGVGFQLLTRETPRALSASVPAASAVTVRLMGSLGPAFAGDILAARAASIERDGIRIDLRPVGADGDSISAVASGDATIGVGRADSFLRARGSGAPIVAFAAGFVESPVAIYTLQKSELRTPQDSVGRRIARQVGDDTAVIYDALMARLGLPRSAIREVAGGGGLSLLLRGDIDVWLGHVGEEAYTLTRQGVDHVVIAPASYGIHIPGTVYFASERTLSERPQLVQRFLKAALAGWERTYEDLAASVSMIAAFGWPASGESTPGEPPLTPDYVRFVLERQRDNVRPPTARFGEFDDRQWRTLQDVLVSQRLLERPLDLTRAVTYDFLRYAYRKPHTFGK